jgi:general secretion pathway protein G
MTLVEILAVVVILGLLAATLTVGVTAKMGKAKRELAKTQIAQWVAQVQTFQLDTGNLPPAAKGISALTATPAAAWYVEPARLKDPWGNQFRYNVPGPGGRPFEIVSYGADGRPGGADDDADISSASLGE